MKVTASILLFWFSLLTVQPTVAEVCRVMHSTESCCSKDKKDCCEEKDSKPCKEADKDSCSGNLCTPCSICSYCFTATVEKATFSFVRNSVSNNLVVIQNKNFLSGFTSQCFQPPEIV